jgi:hypothetical protein
VTFYNDEEGWEFKSPIDPLLKNEVFFAMLSGQFQESQTKRISLPGHSKEVVQQFVCDLSEVRKTSSQQFHQQFRNQQDFNSIVLFNIKLTRLAHQLNQKDLMEDYAQRSTSTIGRYGLQDMTIYELCKLAFDLSLTDLQRNSFEYFRNRPDAMFELDDHVLLKAIFHLDRYTTIEWIPRAIQQNAFKCLKIFFEEIPCDFSLVSLAITQPVTPPDELLKVLVNKYPLQIAQFLSQSMHSSAKVSTATLGAFLRLMPDNFDIWHTIFNIGYLEIIKFAPKSILIQNKGQISFGMTAISKGWLNCVEILLAEGWDPKPTNALTVALPHMDTKLIQMLMKHGAVPNIDTVTTATNNHQRRVPSAAESLSCLYLVEQATLANAFESEIYKAYSQNNGEK